MRDYQRHKSYILSQSFHKYLQRLKEWKWKYAFVGRRAFGQGIFGFGWAEWVLDCWLQGAGEYVANAEMVSKCIQLHLVLSIWYQFTQLSDWGNPAKKLFPLSHSSS